MRIRIGGSTVLNLLFIDVEIILCDLSFRADFYLGFGIDFCKDWLNFYIAVSNVPSGLFIFDIFNSEADFCFSFVILIPNLVASFYSLNPLDEESVISLIQVVWEFSVFLSLS